MMKMGGFTVEKEFSVQLICNSHIFKYLLDVKNRRIRKGEDFFVDQKTCSL
jgi:hypothetical protein